MSATIISTPNASTPTYTPEIEIDYNNQNENIFTMFRGYTGISLTEWASSNTTKPEVGAGSVLEVGGALYEFKTQEAISVGSASAGTVYVVFSASSNTLYLTNTAPAWSITYNGWYDTTVTDRYTGHIMTWDGATTYTVKSELVINNQTGNLLAINVDGYIYTVPGGLAPYNPAVTTIVPSSAYTFPAGFITIISITGTGRPVTIDIYAGSTWNTIYSATTPGAAFQLNNFWSNGANWRFTTSVYDITLNYVVYSS